MSRIRSMPLSSPRSTRLTRGTGASRPSGCQTKASADAERLRARGGRGGRGKVAGDGLQRVLRSAPRWRRSARVAGRFVAVFAGLCAAALEVARAAVFLGFFDIFAVPDRRSLIGPWKVSQAALNEGAGHVAIGPAAAIVRANLPGPAGCPGAIRHGRFFPVSRGLFEC